MDFNTLNHLHAKANTLAYMLWIPLVRQLKADPGVELREWDVATATTAATLALRLLEQLEELAGCKLSSEL